MSKEGRKKHFAAKYPLAWGDQKVEVDVFLTGIANISRDLQTMTISLLACDCKTNRLTEVLPELVAANSGRLGEMGEGFLLRSVNPSKNQDEEHSGREGCIRKLSNVTKKPSFWLKKFAENRAREQRRCQSRGFVGPKSGDP